MRKALIIIIFLLSLGFLLFASGGQDTNCYTIIIGKKASVDGSVIVGHNEDDSGNIIVNLRKIKARDYGSPQRISLGKGAIYETDGKTNEFLWIEAINQEFADSFINQYGLLITSDSCSSKETKDDVADGGIGYMLRRIVAEKANSAREAVKIASELIEKYGYTGSGRTYIFADKNEAWMMAVIRGRHWLAQRVPDDHVAVIPNHYVIREIDLNDTTNFMGSRDIIDYARTNGWYDETKDGSFDFKKAFSRVGGSNLIFDRNTLRHWRGLNFFSEKKWEISDSYPFSFKPGQKVSAESLMDILRDHYEGTEYDDTDGYQKGTPNRTKYRCICTSSTINSLVVSLNAVLPDPISASLWIALGKPDTTVYLPLYYGVESLPPAAGLGTTVHDYALFYKQHFDDSEWKVQKDQLLHTKILRLQKIAEADYGHMRKTIGQKLFPVEKGFIESRKKFEAEISALYSKDKKEALRRLTAYVLGSFEKIKNSYESLLKKYPGN